MYEARVEVFRAAAPRFFQPMWDGRSLNGRHLLIHAEQGLGDAIQFVRYARMCAGRDAQVTLVCDRSLVELFRGTEGPSQILAMGDPLPPFDLHLPMLSQPLVFRTRRESIPNEVPYLFAEPARCAAWKKRLGDDRSHLRVGLTWKGNPGNRRSRIRDIPLETLWPMLGAEHVVFYGLQLGEGAEELRRFPEAARIVDQSEHIHEFADTAALMTELDLIISVDTAVAHLGGALGRPVWTLLPFVPDWRWGLEGETTPWYPTMRLFRQPAMDDWESVIERVAGELRRLAAAPRRSAFPTP
jgi:hypothetical protein